MGKRIDRWFTEAVYQILARMNRRLERSLDWMEDNINFIDPRRLR